MNARYSRSRQKLELWFGPLVALLCWGCASDVLPSRAVAQLEAVARRQGVEIVVANGECTVDINFKKLRCGPPDPELLADYVDLFASEFLLYPIELIQRTGLERVVLCESLSFAGQPRSALPYFAGNTLFLDVESGNYDKFYQREVIHHELFHMIDYRDDGVLYGDDEWLVLNPETFHYGTGGVNAQEVENTGALTDEYPGFLNHYSTTGVEEDKAEIFAHLILSFEYVNSRASTDTVLRSKLDRMQVLLNAFCPEIRGEFWRNAQALER